MDAWRRIASTSVNLGPTLVAIGSQLPEHFLIFVSGFLQPHCTIIRPVLSSEQDRHGSGGQKQDRGSKAGGRRIRPWAASVNKDTATVQKRGETWSSVSG